MITAEEKKEIFKIHGGKETNTGSAEAQIALYTARIQHISDHLKSNRKDRNSSRSLVKLVSKRKNYLKYLSKTDINRYRAILEKLNLRK